jgi:hypothetical protein
MKKITKEQRKKQRKKKRIEYKKRRKLRKEKREIIKPWEPIKMRMIEVPNPFPKNIPKGKRLEIIRNIGTKAKEDFDKKYPNIQKWFKDYDPLYILSFCSLYFVSRPEGIDPEVAGSLDFYHFNLEIMQAFALFQERSFSLKPLMNNAEKLKLEMKEIGELMQLRLLNIPEHLKSDKEILAYKLRTEMISQTTAVRNWAYSYQMKRIVIDLSKLIKYDFEKIYGIDPVRFMELLFKITEERNTLLSKHLQKVKLFAEKKSYKEMMKAYNKAFPENKKIEDDEVEKIWNSVGKNKRKFLGLLIYHSDLKIEEIYSFDIDHALSLYGDNGKRKELKNIFNRLSIRFGDLKDCEKEHIILNNPVHHQPFIIIEEDKYYSAIFGIISHLAINLLEDLISKDENLQKKYSNRIKPNYLEDEIERLFKINFPNAIVFRGSQWIDTSNNKNYENDLLVIIDTFGLIIEAKSGQVTPSARRGAPKILFETLKLLIEEPSEQAHKFIEYLKKNRTIHTFNNKRGEKNVVDSSKINYFIPIGITLANLGIISSNLKKLIEAGITERKISDLAPSISLTDLEVIFELLPFEAEKIHYFARRREIEDHLNYEGDELDLLSFYLENGFNIDETEYNSEIMIDLILKSKEIDPYFEGINRGVKVNKPGLEMTEWWKDILNKLSNKKPKNWLETSFILLNSTKKNQEKFEKTLEGLKKRIRTGKVDKKHNWVTFLFGPKRKSFAVIGYPYITINKEERNNIIMNIFHSEEVKNSKGSVIIGINVNKEDYPYSILAGRLDTQLFNI